VGKVLRDTPLETGGWELEVELPRRSFDQLVKLHPDIRNSIVA
jgi:hypothetical protein